MIPDNVTLIVKAPNQQIDDQNIECFSSWTVKQLKCHLSEVYPTKPKTDEQKIIYSGQLLEDDIILKNVLINYESQTAYTMHLVCTPTRIQRIAKPIENDGLRQRIPETREARPENRQNSQNHNVELQNMLNQERMPNTSMYYDPTTFPTDPVSRANQYLMMRNMSMQYMQYMQQYAQFMQGGDTAVMPPSFPVFQPNVPAYQPNLPNTEAVQAPAQPQEPVIPQEDDEVARDWLDLVYGGFRFLILLTLVYAYSSPLRFLVVAMLIAAGYLQHVGFFRDLAANRNPNQNAEANQRRQDNREQPREVPNEVPNPVPEEAVPNQVPNRPVVIGTEQSFLTASWMIVTSFFASLIPELN